MQQRFPSNTNTFMDSPAKHFILLLIFFSFSTQIHGRESHFFSKTSRPDESATNTPSSLDTTQLPSYEMTGKAVNLPEFPNEKYENKENFNANYNYAPSTSSNKPTFQNMKYGNQEYYNANDNEEKNVANMPEFPNQKYGNTEYYFNSNGRKNENEYGMSDTRFVENGKYFYDVNAEGNGRRPYEPVNENNRYEYNNNKYEDNSEFQDQFINDP